MDIRAAPQRQVSQATPGSPDEWTADVDSSSRWEDEDALNRLDYLILHRELRQQAFRTRVERVAQWCGREVGAGRLSATKADHRIDALVRTFDAETPILLYVVPFDDARTIAKNAFALGLDHGHRELLKAVS